MKPLRWLVLLAVPALLATLPACGNRSTKTKLAFISNNEYEFWKFAERGCRDAEAEFGDVEVEFKMPSGGGSAATQRRFIEDLQAKGVKAIAVSPYDVANQIDFYKEINRQVPLLMVDSDVDTADESNLEARRCYLGTDNVEAGRATGALVKEAVKGGGQFLIFVGRLDVLNAVERRKGVVVELAGGADKCRRELTKMERAEYPIRFGRFELLGTRTDDGKQENCRAKVDDALAKERDLACMVGLWAYNPPAILAGARAAKKAGKVAIVAFDENDETLEGIEDGEIYGTVVQNPYEFGRQAVKIMRALARGDESVFKDYKDMDPRTRVIPIPHRTITKDGKGGIGKKMNIKDFRAEIRRLKAN
jgi:ribose transport system substrate-binding protein